MLVNKTGLLEHIMTQLIETKSRLHGLGLPDHQVEKINFPLKNASSKLYDFYLGYKSEIETNEHLQKENEELNRRVIELQQADMTHEYNNAEALRVWPQIEQQIRDDEREKILAELKLKQ